MSYTRIQARVTDQAIQLVNVPLIASGGMNEVRVDFNFCSKWDSLGKTAVFYQNPEQAYHVLMTEDSAVVPAEVLAKDGLFYFGVFGTGEDQVRTTEVVSMTIVKGAITFNHIEPSEPTPDIYQQLLAAYSELTTLSGKASVVRVKDTNGGKDVTFWTGTQAEYDALEKKELNRMYLITDDTTVHITGYWEDVDFRHYFHQYSNGMRKGTLQAVWSGLSFTTEHNGLYVNDAGRVRAVLDAITNGVVPEYCSVNVTKATMTDENGEETFAPPILAMVCGKPETVAGYGVASPRILMMAYDRAENVTVELEIHCVWKVGDSQ